MARVSNRPRLAQLGLLALLLLPATSAEYGIAEPVASSSTFPNWLTIPTSGSTAFSGPPEPTGSASLPGPISPVPTQTGQLGPTNVASSSGSLIPTAGELTVFAGQPFSFSLLNIIKIPIESVLAISVDPPADWVLLDPLNKALQGLVPVDCEVGSVLRVTITSQLPNGAGLVPRQASGGVNQFVVLMNILASPSGSITFSSTASTNTFGVSSTLGSQATTSSTPSTSGTSSRLTSRVDSTTQTRTPTSSTSPSGTSSTPIPTIQAGKLFQIPLQTYLRNAFDVVLLISTQPLYPWVGLGLGNELVGLVPLDQPAGILTVTATALSLGSPVYTVPVTVIVLAAEVPTSTTRSGPSSSVSRSRSSSSSSSSSISSSQTASPSSSGVALPAFTLVPGQPFIFPILLYFKNAGSDRGTGITTNPGSPWIIFDQFLQSISGIVPLTQPNGPVSVTLSVTTLAGISYSLDIPIVILGIPIISVPSIASPTTLSTTGDTTSTSGKSTTASTTGPTTPTTKSSTSSTTKFTTSSTTRSTTSSATSSSTSSTTKSTTSSTANSSTSSTTGPTTLSTAKSTISPSSSSSTSSSCASSATSTPIRQFSCSSLGYVVQGTIFYELDLDRGSLTTLNPLTYGVSIIDAIGYNILDNFIYGLAQTGTGAGDLIRIGQSGQSQPVVRGLSPPVLNNIAAVFYAGDVDEQGIFWAATSLTGNNGQTYFSFDLRPGSGTYGTILSQGKSTVPYPISDWAYVPGGSDYLYALGQVPIGLNYPLGTTALIRFDRRTHLWSTVRIYGGLYGTNAWGAVFAKYNGYLYAVDSITGQTWKFPVTTSGSPIIQSYSLVLALPNLDGAGCFLGA